jgi:hypothetical protein
VYMTHYCDQSLRLKIISTRLSVLFPSALYSSAPSLSLSTLPSLPLVLPYNSVARSLLPLYRPFPRHTAARLFPVTTWSAQCEEGWAEVNELLWLALLSILAAPGTSLLSFDYYTYITHPTRSSIARRNSLAALHPC